MITGVGIAHIMVAGTETTGATITGAGTAGMETTGAGIMATTEITGATITGMEDIMDLIGAVDIMAEVTMGMAGITATTVADIMAAEEM